MKRSSKLFIIPKDEFYQLYMVENKSLEELKEFYHCSIDKMYRYQKMYGFIKTEKQKAECRKNTNLRKYNVTTIMNYEPVKNKYKQTNRIRRLNNIDTYNYDKTINKLKRDFNINITREELFDLLCGSNKQLFIKILKLFNKRVTFFDISNLLSCSMDTLYSLNRVYNTHNYFKWNRSYYEEYIRNHFEIFNISFEREKTFDDLRGLKGGCLRFDFYLPEFNSCIEYDGEQHYINPTSTISIHDQIKNEYCKSHNIRLYRLNKYYFTNLIIADRALELIHTGRPIDYNYLERGV